ncbi:MAG: PP0621 family protein [Rhodoferax sp.]
MRYLLLLIVLVLLVWRWRSLWAPARRTPTQTHAASSIEMRQCRQCGVHLPASEAVAGNLGHYCSQDHRKLAEP